jgi:streptogramin lyase
MSVDTGGRRAAQALLRASERLGPPPDLGRLRRRHRRRTAGRVGLAAAVLVAAAVVGRALPGLERVAPAPARPAAPALALPGVPGMDRHVRDVVATGRAVRAHVAAGPSAVWVLNRPRTGPATLVRVDPANDEVVARIDAGLAVSQLAVGDDGSPWLYRAGSRLDRPQLVRVDPATNRVADVVDLPVPAPSTPAGASALLVAGGSVWLAVQEGQLLQLDPASRELREVTDGGRSVAADHLAYAGGWVWATRGLHLYRLDPRRATVTSTVSDPDLHGSMPGTGLAGGAGGLWLLGVEGGEQLFRLDPATGRILAEQPFGQRSGGRIGTLAAGDRVVAARVGPRLVLADAAGAIRADMPVPEAIGGLAVGSGAVWVADPARGRLLRVDPGF